MGELEKTSTDNEKIALILEEIESLNRKIDLIFGSHILFDGQFKDITKKD